MNLKQRYVLIFVLCFITYHVSATQADSLSLPVANQHEREPFKGYMRLNLENDMLVLRQKTDRYFTSGTKL